jgi:hypothetical protein
VTEQTIELASRAVALLREALTGHVDLIIASDGAVVVVTHGLAVLLLSGWDRCSMRTIWIGVIGPADSLFSTKTS